MCLELYGLHKECQAVFCFHAIHPDTLMSTGGRSVPARALPGRERCCAVARVCLCLLAVALGVAVAASATASASDETPLTAEALRAGLRSIDPDDDAYLTYIAALAEQGQIPRSLVQSTYLWARQKPYPRRAKYFKQAIILRAAREGITLPTGTPPTTGTIKGRVYVGGALASVPIPGATVRLEGTNRRTTTDAAGHYKFENVPLGRYTLRASGALGPLELKGSTEALVPSPPPSTSPTVADIRVR